MTAGQSGGPKVMGTLGKSAAIRGPTNELFQD